MSQSPVFNNKTILYATLTFVSPHFSFRVVQLHEQNFQAAIAWD